MRRVIAITDPDDSRISDYRDIRERDLVGRRRGFIAEGEVVLEKMLSSGRCRTLSLLIAETRLDRLAPLLAMVAADTPIFSASQPVLDHIAGFHLHRGILAFAELADRKPPHDLMAGLSKDALLVGLLGIANHDNMGGVFRNAAAFGADGVLLDAQCCDPLYRKAIRVSVGASLLTPFSQLGRHDDMIALLGAAGFEILALSPAGSIRLADVRRSPRTAILFGAEGPGLPGEVLARTKNVSIPIVPGFDSLNLATASGIVLHHLTTV